MPCRNAGHETVWSDRIDAIPLGRSDYMRIVLDTCVLVAAARSRHWASNALMSLLPDRRIQPAVSVPLFVEYRATLLRGENLGGRSAREVDDFLDYLLSFSHLQEIHYRWRPAAVLTQHPPRATQDSKSAYCGLLREMRNSPLAWTLRPGCSRIRSPA
ncbi:PIN domain-containing protein [Lamprobacter modestohalophilus]|uniref:PIN domain-containing protein n=1 Tax=Lamprobacter modestohalophilus TaxID=1064514 RepID=UPI003D18D27E